MSDILESIAKIKSRITNSDGAFQHDEILQVWVIHHLQVIGEAARGVSHEFRERYPEVPWPEIVALRNILVHDYFGLNLQQVWTMTQKDLPEPERQVRRIHSEIAADPGGCGG